MLKIAIVCGHFMPEIGYYEVHLAETLAKLGYPIRVFTSNRSNLKKRRQKIYPSGLISDPKSNIEIYRLKPIFKLGATILSRNILRETIKYNPDLVLAIGIAKLFPIPVLLAKKNRDFLLYTFFGENKEFYTWHNFSSILKHGIKLITRSILKRPFYHIAIKNSDKVFLYTPETIDFLCNLVSKKSELILKTKAVNTSLGFDSSKFYFDPVGRDLIRKAQGIEDEEFVILTVTRYSNSKGLEFMVHEIIKFRQMGFRVRYWIMGFDNQDSLLYFKKFVQANKADEFITCIPFMSFDDLRNFQSAADIGLWCQVTISIQQSMGSGLPVLLEEKKSVSHLVNNNITGLFFTKNELLEKLKYAHKLYKPKDKDEFKKMRQEIERINHAIFSNEKLVSQIISI